MGKCVAYVAAAVVFMGLGALIAGACVWFLAPKEKGTVVPRIPEVRDAQCVIANNENGVSGVIDLRQSRFGPNNPLNITVNITGVTEGLHGFHIHTYGVPASGSCSATGGHYNPKDFPHGAPTDPERHVGDLGNINVTDSTGFITQITDHVANLWGDESIVGRAFVIHAGEDDLGVNDDDGSKTTGNAGGRLACCTIYLVPS